MEKKIVCFGEVLLRLSPSGSVRLRQAHALEMHFGGAEANVAACVAQLAAETQIEKSQMEKVCAVLVSAVPNNELGAAAVQFFRGLGVDTSFIKRDGERLGLYFVENGSTPRPSQVIYDRNHSAITTIYENEFDWEVILSGAAWFHWTGITAALSGSVRAEILRACTTAKKLGVQISCDLNYRQKLWTPAEAQAAMIPLMEYMDCCISNEQDAGICLDVRAGEHSAAEQTIGGGVYERLAEKMHTQFGFSMVALSVRSSSSESSTKLPAGFITKRALFSQRHATTNECCFSRSYVYAPHEHIGGGDAFAGGLLYALACAPDDARAALEFAVAASVLKQTVPSDVAWFSEREVRAFLGQSSAQSITR